jgi:hypothetical protein
MIPTSFLTGSPPGIAMNHEDRNLRIAEAVSRDFAWEGQSFEQGDFVAILDGRIITVAKTVDDAIAALRARDPNPMHGMVVEVAPETVDVIRGIR